MGRRAGPARRQPRRRCEVPPRCRRPPPCSGTSGRCRTDSAALARVWGCDACRGFRLAFEFLVLTATRSGEVRHARWPEIETATAGQSSTDERNSARAVPVPSARTKQGAKSMTGVVTRDSAHHQPTASSGRMRVTSLTRQYERLPHQASLANSALCLRIGPASRAATSVARPSCPSRTAR